MTLDLFDTFSFVFEKTHTERLKVKFHIHLMLVPKVEYPYNFHKIPQVDIFAVLLPSPLTMVHNNSLFHPIPFQSRMIWWPLNLHAKVRKRYRPATQQL